MSRVRHTYAKARRRRIIRILIRLVPNREYVVHTECVEPTGQEGAADRVSHFNRGKYYRFKADDHASHKTALIKAFNDFMLRSKSLLESNWTQAIVLE